MIIIRLFVLFCCCLIASPAWALTGEFLGVTGEDLVGPSDQIGPNGVPDWHLRLTGVKPQPMAVQIVSLDAGAHRLGVWLSPQVPPNWIILAVVTGMVVDLFFEPDGTPTSFDVTVTYADGSVDAATNLPFAAPPPPPPPPPVPPPTPPPSPNAPLVITIQVPKCLLDVPPCFPSMDIRLVPAP